MTAPTPWTKMTSSGTRSMKSWSSSNETVAITWCQRVASKTNLFLGGGLTGSRPVMRTTQSGQWVGKLPQHHENKKVGTDQKELLDKIGFA
jgi:hypothetical protein